MRPPLKTLNGTIEACVANADRLLDDPMQLEFQKPQATRLYLILIAQEELAKAFILVLVRQEKAPATCSRRYVSTPEQKCASCAQ